MSRSTPFNTIVISFRHSLAKERITIRIAAQQINMADPSYSESRKAAALGGALQGGNQRMAPESRRKKLPPNSTIVCL